MNMLNLISINIISLLFLSTSIDKLCRWKKHYYLAEQYQLIKGLALHITLISFLICELTISISYFIVGPNLLNVLFTVILLIIYSTAIAVNIKKGNHEISCGCGGILESNHLHIGIIIRNIIIIIISIYSFVSLKNDISFLSFDNLISVVYTLIIFVFYITIEQINKINYQKINIEKKL